MPIRQTLSQSRVPVHVWTEDVDAASLAQLARTADLPFAFHHVAAMPDVHFGLGATVGSVLATRGAIVPAAVGVDIGCGMAAVRTTLEASRLPDSLARLRAAIEARTPVGFAMHAPARVRDAAARRLEPGYRALLDRHPGLDERGQKVEKLEVLKMAESPELLPTNDYSYQPSFVDDRAGSYCERYVASGFGDVAYIILAGLAYAAASSYGGGYSANSDDC